MTHVGARQPSSDNDILDLARSAGCTTRQLQILQLKARGYGNPRIGKILGISAQAVASSLDGSYRRIQRVRAEQ